RADEILMLIRIADEFGFKIATFQHVLEGYKVAKEIAAHGAGASTFSDWWGYKIEAVDAIPQNAALMTRKGVIVSVNSDSAELAKEKETLIAAERGERRNPSTTDGDGNGNGHGAAVGIAIDRDLASPPAQRLTTPTKGIVVITNARIFPIGKPPIDRGTIVIRDGIIASVGANVAVPAGAQQLIDAAGADVYP